MSEDKTLLQQAFDMLDDYEKESDGNSLVLLAVEFDKNGFPASKAMKCVGPPGGVLACGRILLDMVDEIEEETLTKLSKMSEASEKLKSLFEEMGITDMNDPRIAKMMQDPEMSSQFMNLLKDLKRKFGK